MKLISRAAALFATLTAIQCASSSMPTAPASTIAVALNAATIAAGATVQGTISVANPPASGATIALSSSNPAVAAVPSTVALQAGATTASFTVSAIAAGTAT